MSEPRDEAPGSLGSLDSRKRDRVPALVGGRQRAVQPREHVVQVAPAVLGHAEEPGPAAEQPGGQRPLQRVRRGQVRDPRGDRGRGEPVSASATSTASNTRVSDGVGRRSATSQKASSPKLTLPIRSAVRSWPSSLIWSAVEVPSEVGKERPAASLIPPPPAPPQDVPATGGSRPPAGPGRAAAGGSWPGSRRT